MLTAEALKRKIQSAQDLLGVVKTMKALAAVSIRQYQRAVESLADYNRTVEMGLQIVLKDSRGVSVPAGQRSTRMVAIVFRNGSGTLRPVQQYRHPARHRRAGPDERPERGPVFHRCRRKAADILVDMGQNVFEVLATPGSTAGITSMVQDITMLLENWRFSRSVENMHLFLQRICVRRNVPSAVAQASARG